MTRLLLLAVLALAGCAAPPDGRYPVIDVVHGPNCGRASAPAC